MEIKLYSSLDYFNTSYMETKKSSATAPAAHKLSRNFDGVTIKSEQSPTAEQIFAGKLSSRISLEIRQPVSEKKITDLQEQIQKGSYEVDVNAIADKIMLY